MQIPGAPSISQVVPQTIAAGTKGATVKVSGTNFTQNAVILWNGAPLVTSIVDAQTLAGTVQNSSLATPSTVQLQVQNTQTMESSSAVPLTISAPTTPGTPILISTGSLPQASAGTVYSATLVAAGGTPVYTWSVTAGQLPSGLTLSATTGVLSGTPVTSGSYSFEVTATDSSSPVQTAEVSLTMLVGAAAVVPPPASPPTTPTPPTPPPAPLPLTLVPAFPSGVTGTAYSGVLQISGGTAPYTLSAVGLPAGLTLANTGVVSGVPAASGTSSVTFTVVDSGSPAQSQSVTSAVVVAPTGLSISTSTLPSGTVGSVYSDSLQVSGGTAPYTWSATGLPAGLSVAGNGQITGTPTVSGTSSVTATVVDSSNPTLTRSVSMLLTVAPTALLVSTSSLPAATVGSVYSDSLQVSGGTAPYTWSTTALPAGLTVARDGQITGTPTASGTTSVIATVVDSSSPVQSKSVTLSLSVSASALSISTSNLPAAIVGSVYSDSLQVSGGTAPYKWSATALPAGLSLASNGQIAGTPTASGTTTVTATVVDSSSPAQSKSVTLSLSVSASALTISTATLPAATVGSVYSDSLQVSGGTAPYTWSATALPAGLTVASNGQITGTPTSSGTASVIATVVDSSSPAQSKSVTLSLSVSASALTISTSTLPAGTVGSAYLASLQVSGGTAPYTWSATGLPAGLGVTSSGQITGTPMASGITSVTATVVDSSSPAQSRSVRISIAVSPAALVIGTSALPAGTKGTEYSTPLQASGGTAPYTWSLTSGALPSGLSVSGGSITGNPQVSGSFTVGLTVRDSSSPALTASTQLTLSVGVGVSPLTITTVSLSGATVNLTYSAAMVASGGTAPYTWVIDTGSSLPSGLVLAPSTGVVSGIATAAGSFSFMATVTDSSSPAQTQTAKISVNVAAVPLVISSSTLPGATDGTAYSSSMIASGGTPGYTWSVSGSLPAGLTLAAGTGVISGTPTATGTSSFTLTVTDSGNPAQTKSAAASITVAAAAPTQTTGRTWYVRPDGGTRYSSNITTGQCDGTADASYASTGGTGINQHCAFNDVRFLWSDGSYTYGTSTPGWGWIGSGGDTYLIRGSLGTGVSYRVGWNDASNYCDANGCWGITGSPAASGAPPPPSGTASQHTRILGENYAACHSASAKTQLHGGWQTGTVLALNGVSYVDVACLDITDFSACGRQGQALQCDSSQDFAQNGISLTNTTTNVTLTDIHIHGMAANGLAGPTGTGVVMDYIDLLGNASSGWNSDPGDGTTGVGTLSVSHYNISWNGCAEEYPVVDALPYQECRDDVFSGYGDGFGTATAPSAPPGWQVTFDTGVASYNTQDGLDALHINGVGSSMTVKNTMAYGNEGQQIKAGPTPTLINNLIIGNCAALLQAIPGTPANFNSSNMLGDTCRAGNTAVLLYVNPLAPTTYQFNTMYSNNAVGLEIEYQTTDTGPANIVKYNNNVFLGFLNVGSESNSSVIYSNGDLNMLTNPGASWTNNSTIGQNNNWSCPHPGESNAVCSDPGLTDETFHLYGYGNMTPSSSGSIIVGKGVAIPGITTDYTGATRSNPPSIGAYE